MLFYNKEETQIGFLEVPDEINVLIVMTGCPYHCAGCHSQHNWKQSCNELTTAELESILNKYKDQVTCACFMGGDWDKQSMIKLLKKARSMGFKTALYSGADTINSNYTKYLDYYKVGSYKKEFGGLDNPSTNQVFYKITNGEYENITKRFQK